MSGAKNTFIQSWLPPAIYFFLLQLLDKLKFSKADKKLLESNSSLGGIAKGKRAFVLATGPSIKLEDLKVLKGEDCFSVSNFFLHEDLNTVHPKFHFFAPFHPPLILENFVAWLKQADEKLPADTEIVLGYTDAEIVKQYGLFPKRKVHYLYLAYHVKVGRISLQKPILWPQSGPLMILPVLLAMGYEKIYLLGCDHTVLRDFRKQIPHFYDKEKDTRQNASDPGAWADIIQAHQYSMNTFVQYEKYKKAISAHYPGVEIINLSQDSWLDIFRQEKLENLF